MELVVIIAKIVVGLMLAGITSVTIISKCFFLAPSPAGILVVLTNLVYETFYKKYYWRRWNIDAVAVVILAVGWAWVGGPWTSASILLVIAMAWTYTMLLDSRWRNGELAVQDRRYSGKGEGGKKMFMPLPLPKLIMIIRGPAVERKTHIDLGDLPEGNEDEYEILILNPSMIVPQLPMTLEFSREGDTVEITGAPAGDQKTPGPGGISRFTFRLRAVKPGGGTAVNVRLAHGTYEVAERLAARSVVPKAEAYIKGADIRKWKYGASAGFAWRGDQDLYDPATFQSAEGLRLALSLNKKFHLPTTLYISGRLSFDQDEHRKFCEYLGVDRKTEEIPDFIRFLREECDLRSEMEFPVKSDRPYYMELGNHMYLHYGTHSVICEENNWQMRSEMGTGQYPWQGEDKSLFGEQRDNAQKNVDVIRDKIGITIRSWGVPGRANDKETGRALEAAGMVVASDCDASAWDNVMRLPAPHHPAGCKHLVELTKKYPGDCTDGYKIAILKYWLALARRTGRVFVYMAHHHLMLYEGWACYRLTEEFFRYALAETHGDLYPASVCSLGLYWERVLCPEHRWVKIEASDKSVTVKNTGGEYLDNLPLEIELPGGRKYMKLVNIPAGGETNLTIG